MSANFTHLTRCKDCLWNRRVHAVTGQRDLRASSNHLSPTGLRLPVCAACLEWYDAFPWDHDLEMRRAAQKAAIEVIGPYTRGILAVDFDETLQCGENGHEGVAALVTLRERGYGIVIHTSNIDHDGVRAWLAARWPDTAGPLPPVTDVKPQATAYIDDKARRFVDWPSVLAEWT